MSKSYGAAFGRAPSPNCAEEYPGALSSPGSVMSTSITRPFDSSRTRAASMRGLPFSGGAAGRKQQAVARAGDGSRDGHFAGRP